MAEKSQSSRYAKMKQACADARDILSGWLADRKIPMDDQTANLLAQLQEALH